MAFTSEDRGRDVIGNFSAGGFGSLCPKYRGGRPPEFALAAAAGGQEDRQVQAGRA